MPTEPPDPNRVTIELRNGDDYMRIFTLEEFVDELMKPREDYYGLSVNRMRYHIESKIASLCSWDV
jgi:hypothetical protein